jgi:hypothetical protein
MQLLRRLPLRYPVLVALHLALMLTMAPGWAQTTPQYIASVDEKTGLPQLTKGGANAMTPSFAFWGAKWSWAGLEVGSGFKTLAPFQYTLAGKSRGLDLDLSADIQKNHERQLVWTLNLDARSARADVVGGGMVFKFDLVNFGAEMGEPALLPDNRGWVWGRDGKARLELRFEPPLASVYFEQGKKTEVRAFFYKDAITQGRLQHTVTLAVSGEAGIGPTTGERFGLADPSTWPVDTLDWKTAPVDLAFLNAPEAPAGKRGFVKAMGDRLQFADGSVARFWGTNLSAYALYGTPKEAVRLQARRLSALGFNLVRLHHHDSPWMNPNIFGDAKTPSTQRLSTDALDRLDWWIKCLKDEGIYVWLDLHVQRVFKPADNIFGFDEIRKGKDVADLKGYSYVNPGIQSAMQRFNEAYVTHVNPYTGKAHKDEPAIAAVLITNENDITHHFGNALLPDKQVPGHNRLYMAEADSFARSHHLPTDKVWRSWEYGPSKLFLNDLERRVNAGALAHLRSLGVQVPVASTSTWGGNPLSSLPALTVGDVIDVHAYGGQGQLDKSPLITPNIVHWMAAGHVVGKPMTVSEWNAEPFPTPDRHTLPLFVAGAAGHQGWDAMLQYAYSQEPSTGPGSASNWHAHNDPSLLATLPAAALMYRQGHVREATTTFVFDPGAELLFNQPLSPVNALALRTAAELGKLQVAMPASPALPWLTKAALPPGATVLRDPSASVLQPGTTEVTTDTGEITHNWGKGTYLINTPRTQAAMGWLGGEVITLQDVTIKTSTRNATVAVQSLDGAGIAQSKSLLISLGTRAVPRGKNQLPFHVEPLVGEIRIRAPKGLKLSKRDGQQQVKDVAMVYRDGVYTLLLDNTLQTSWLFMRAAQ